MRAFTIPILIVLSAFTFMFTYTSSLSSDTEACLKFKLNSLLNEQSASINYENITTDIESNIVNSEFINRKEVNNISLLAVAPTTESDFKDIFGLLPTKKRLSVMSKVKSNLDDLKMPKKYTNKKWNKTTFGKYIKENDSPFIAILGHNENGMFKFSGNSEMKLNDMAKICNQHNKNCIFISCSSNDWIKEHNQLSIKPVINYNEAIYIINKLSSQVVSLHRNTSIKELSKELELIVAKSKINTKVKYIVDKSCKGSLAIALIVGLEEISD